MQHGTSYSSTHSFKTLHFLFESRGNNSWDKNIQILALKAVSILTNQLQYQRFFVWLVSPHIEPQRHQSLPRRLI